jgi:hypothetical protein
MNPNKAERLEGARLAFAQGGPLGIRLVYLTPPVRVSSHRNCIEATWIPHKMPFRYLEAPVLVGNRGASNFPLLEAALRNGKRSTLEGQFASNFRSRTTQLETPIAKELIRTYSNMRKQASCAAIAVCYTDALPKLPPCVDADRQQTYSSLLGDAEAKSLDSELSNAYATNAVRNRALWKEFAPMDAPISGCRPCAPRRHY